MKRFIFSLLIILFFFTACPTLSASPEARQPRSLTMAPVSDLFDFQVRTTRSRAVQVAAVCMAFALFIIMRTKK